jgi:hypothetical protein
MSTKNYTIGDRTRDLPACSAQPQPAAPPPTPCASLYVVNNKHVGWSVQTTWLLLVCYPELFIYWRPNILRVSKSLKYVLPSNQRTFYTPSLHYSGDNYFSSHPDNSVLWKSGGTRIYFHYFPTNLISVCVAPSHLNVWILYNIFLLKSRDSAVRLGDELDDQEFESRQGQELFSNTSRPRPVLGPILPPTYRVPGFYPGG